MFDGKDVYPYFCVNAVQKALMLSQSLKTDIKIADSGF
jgi:hypothetical protein